MKVSILAGGTAGAKLARGFTNGNDEVTIIANVGDDVEVFGLHISPDVDSIVYSLAGIFDYKRNWGIEEDTFNAFKIWQGLGVDPMLMLGDKDLAFNVYRTNALKRGLTLTKITLDISERLHIKGRVLPATDDPLTTMVDLASGSISFEEYYLRYSNIYPVKSIHYKGSSTANASEEILDALDSAELIIISPSNPLASIYPIISINGIRKTLISSKAKKVAISPFIGGRAIKGPAVNMIRSFGLEPNPKSVARLYLSIIDTLIVDESDSQFISGVKEMGIKIYSTNTLMETYEEMVSFAQYLKRV